MPHYKLVCNKISQIIKAAGKICICSVLSEQEYRTLLDAKLNEEVAEYQESDVLEEVADILEVIHTMKNLSLHRIARCICQTLQSHSEEKHITGNI